MENDTAEYRENIVEYIIRDEGIIVVSEPQQAYNQQFDYHGETINGAIKDYYGFVTNREKVSVLKWIVQNGDFQKLNRFSTKENAVYGLNISQYDNILISGEMPKNLAIAEKFVQNKFDVFLLSNPSDTKSADFIIRQKNRLLYVEGKTSSGGSSLSHRLEEGAIQADRIAVNFISLPTLHEIVNLLPKIFSNQQNLKELYMFKKSQLIRINRDFVESKNFSTRIEKLWNRHK